MRSKLIDIAATLDRIDRAVASEVKASSIDDSRRATIDEAIRILLDQSGAADRARQLQQLFSRPYSAKWRRDFGL